MTAGAVLSVNVSPVRTIAARGAEVPTGILKAPVAGRVALRGVNLRGDEQADREAHGGPWRAVYAYAREDYAWWERELGASLPAGRFGENLTLEGVDVTGARIGERWRIGSAVLRVTSPRVPCYKLATVMGDPRFVARFADALRPGAYLAIETEGELGAGDAVGIVDRPAHDVTIGTMARIYFRERERLRDLLVDDLPPHWRAWVLEHAAS